MLSFSFLKGSNYIVHFNWNSYNNSAVLHFLSRQLGNILQEAFVESSWIEQRLSRVYDNVTLRNKLSWAPKERVQMNRFAWALGVTARRSTVQGSWISQNYHISPLIVLRTGCTYVESGNVQWTHPVSDYRTCVTLCCHLRSSQIGLEGRRWVFRNKSVRITFGHKDLTILMRKFVHRT